jgi:hypothetical protein
MSIQVDDERHADTASGSSPCSGAALCKKGVCDLEIRNALFRGQYVYCRQCKKSAGIAPNGSGAVQTWNAWLEGNNGRI